MDVPAQFADEFPKRSLLPAAYVQGVGDAARICCPNFLPLLDEQISEVAQSLQKLLRVRAERVVQSAHLMPDPGAVVYRSEGPLDMTGV
jgi:hypothetical protein